MNAIRIIVFAKAPQAGMVKTRLIPALGAQAAADLAARMLQHTLRTALDAQIGAVELCASPAPDDELWSAHPLPAGISVSAQGEGDLGQRLARAAQRCSALGEAVILIGTDCPVLSAAHLRSAAQSLADAPACMIPTLDGGYALLALRRFDASLFEEIPWSTAAVAEITLQRAAALGWRLHCLAAVRDIDEPSDLVWLPNAWLA